METIYTINLLEKARGKVVIIDIDGTLIPDKQKELPDHARVLLHNIAAVARVVFVSSNGPNDRTLRFARDAGVLALVGARKPSRTLAHQLPPGERVVIGDKWLTDGLFASKIGASFIHVAHIRHANECLSTKTIFFIDEVYGRTLPYLKLARVHQWLKNGLVFAPLFFAGEIVSLSALFPTIVAYFSFCFLASGMYVVNDIIDRDADAAHPIKQQRPIPAGNISVIGASLFSFVLFAVVGAMLYILPSIIPAAIAYITINSAYSLWLKHVVGVDVVLVASSHVVRLVAGGAAASIFVSPWILLCAFFGALFLVVGKRRGELRHPTKRRVLSAYTPTALHGMLLITMALALISYSIYTIIGSHIAYAEFSIIFVAIALFRVLNVLLSDGSIVEYPERLVIRDRVVLGSFIAWGAYMFLLIYL